MGIIHIQQAIYQGLGCNLPFMTIDIWDKMDEKFNGLAGVVEAYNQGKKSKEYKEIKKFIEKNII